MIFVTVGTHEDAFDALVEAAEQVAIHTDERVVVQRGYSRVRADHCEVYELLPADEIEAFVGKARVVVCHAGPATILTALAHGRVPIVVPRRSARGEHVDEHQLAFARRVADRVHLVEDPAGLGAALAEHEAVAQLASRAQRDPERFAHELGELVDGVVARRRTRTSLLRAALMALVQGR